MDVRKLSDLREPPVVGQFYMVPVIREYPYFGKMDTWPVIGPRHTDDDFFNFPMPHYHIDARFLTKAQVRHIETDYRGLVAWVGSSPLAHRDIPVPTGRPVLARRKCRAASYGYSHGERDQVRALNAHYAEPEAIRLADGRLLCPHRKADLSQFPAGADGMVTCPLHGLRVRCAPRALEITDLDRAVHA